MKDRREFLKSMAALGVTGLIGAPVSKSVAQTPAVPDKIDDRTYWLAVTERLARPVLENLARRELKKRMPVEARDQAGRPRKIFAP